MADDIWTAERINRAVELFSQGKSAAEISIDLGEVVSRSAIGAKLNRMGIKRGPDHLRTGPISSRMRLTRVNSNSNAMRVTVVRLPNDRKIRSTETESRMIPFLELEANDCRYPIGDTPLFCGNPKIEGSSYCGPHDRLCCHAAQPRTNSYFPSIRKR